MKLASVDSNGSGESGYTSETAQVVVHKQYTHINNNSTFVNISAGDITNRKFVICIYIIYVYSCHDSFIIFIVSCFIVCDIFFDVKKFKYLSFMRISEEKIY